ncbi:hypothetical protein EPO44_03705 [bacterium]|nr:MAG: hypothetical protein EPO44_03705 [bacterium]
MKQGMDPRAPCDLLNRLLLSLGISPVSVEFFDTVFSEVDFQNLEQVRQNVDNFRTLCMLEYGNFRYGYKQLRQGNLIEDRWKQYFPSAAEARERSRKLSQRPEPSGLVSISGSQLFSLGYLAGEYAQKINDARKKLLEIIDRAIAKGVVDFGKLQGVAEEMEEKKLTTLFAKAGIPGTEMLMYPDLPLFGGGRKNYTDILLSIRENCVTVDEDAIARAQQAGIQNARTYMAMHDIDVYVATSMRDPLHFTSNWAFIQRLFHQGDLAAWRMHYFDPTQAYLQDRIQKGLLECLMIKRARLSVYNAQEGDTFGKDSEAGVTLAQRKPVIVYVARLFEELPELRGFYNGIDEGARVERDRFVEHVVKIKGC